MYCGVHRRTLQSDKAECPLCFDTMTNDNAQKTSCGHIYHKACMIQWLTCKNICPLCNSYLKPTQDELDIIIHRLRGL